MGSNLAGVWAKAAAAPGSSAVVMGGRARIKARGTELPRGPRRKEPPGPGCPVHRASLEVGVGLGLASRCWCGHSRGRGPYRGVGTGEAGTGEAEPWHGSASMQQGTERPQGGRLTGLCLGQAQWCCDQRLRGRRGHQDLLLRFHGEHDEELPHLLQESGLHLRATRTGEASAGRHCPKSPLHGGGTGSPSRSPVDGVCARTLSAGMGQLRRGVRSFQAAQSSPGPEQEWPASTAGWAARRFSWAASALLHW